MANSNLLLAWLQKLTQVRAASAASGYPASNVLDLDDLSAPWRSTDLTGEWLEFVAGIQVLGESAGLPESGPPIATITRVKIDPSGRYVFAIENGVFRVWPWNKETGEYGTRVADRSGSNLAFINDFDVMQSGSMLYVLLCGTRSSGVGSETCSFDPAQAAWGTRWPNPGNAETATACVWIGTTRFAVYYSTTNVLQGSNFDAITGPNSLWQPASNPSSDANQLAVSPDFGSGLYVVAAAIASSPRIEAWPHDTAVDITLAWGTKFTNPGTLPAGTGRSVAFSKAIYSSNAYLAVGHDTTPFLSVYPCSSSAFGAKLGNPGSLPAASGRGVAFRAGDAFLAVGQDNASAPIDYAFNNGGGGSIGTKYSMFNPPAAAGGRAVDFSLDGKFLVAGHSTDPFLLTIPFATAAVSASIGVVFVRWPNATAAATIRCRLGTDVTFASNNFDSGTDPAFPSGITDDNLEVYAPNIWIIPPSEAAAEYMRLDFTDAANPDGFIEIGAVFAAPIFQPSVNMNYDWVAGIDDLTRSSESESGHRARQPRPKRRTLEVTLGFLTETEMLDAAHALMMLGSEQHVVALPAPNEATGKMNFQVGIFGRLVSTRRIVNPFLEIYALALVFEEDLP